jgi:hypothetical protein
MEPTLPQGLVTMATMPATEGMKQEKLENAVYKKFWQGTSPRSAVIRPVD